MEDSLWLSPTDTSEGGNWSPASCFCKIAEWDLSQLPTQACLTCGWGEGRLQFFLLVFGRNRGGVAKIFLCY